MSSLHSWGRGNFLAAFASILMAGAVGCASNSASPNSEVPANTIKPSTSSVRGLGELASPAMSAGSDESRAAAVKEKTLTGGAAARGFDFEGGGGGGGGGGGNGGSGPVNFQQLGSMLQSLGSTPQTHNGIYVFNIKEDDTGLTYPLGVSLSEDQRAIYFVVPLFEVNPQGWASQTALLKLLSANSSICPSSFGIVDRKLFILLGIANTNIAPETLKQALAYMFSTVHKTQPLWGPWMQAGNSGGDYGGGGNPGGGGGNPGGGGSGGNPFQ